MMNMMMNKISALLLKSTGGAELDLSFTTKNVGDAFLLMLLGMVGIFVVMLVIMLAVKLLNTFAKDKDDKK